MRSRVGRTLTIVLGLLLLAFGVAETVTHRDDTVGALAFWSGTLLGGAALVLTGVAVWSRRPVVGCALTTAGACLALLPTAWTLVVPLLAVAVIVLGIRDLAARSEPSSTGPPAK